MFGIAKDIRSEVRECTPDLLNQALDAAHVARTCAEIEDALEAYKRGELTKDEYETLKGKLKKRLPIFTFHATFRHGRRKNHEAIPSGLSIYDLDHIENPREIWTSIEPRAKELGIVLAHISPERFQFYRIVYIQLMYHIYWKWNRTGAHLAQFGRSSTGVRKTPTSSPCRGRIPC